MNLDKLKELMGNDPEKVRNFIADFKIKIPLSITKLREATEILDWETISIEAHNIKNQTRYFELESITSLAEKVELMADNKSVEELDFELINKLENGLNDILSQGFDD